MGIKWKNVLGVAAAPFTGGASLLATDYAKKAWNDFTGKTATQMANAANIAEAEKNRAWQEMMSNTAYQRQARDLLAAGLNPVAATSLGGASTGTGAQAEITPEPSDSQGLMNTASIAGTVAGGFNAIGSGVNQMAQAARTSAETPFVPQAQKANIANTTADTVQKQANTQNLRASTDEIREKVKNLQQQWDLMEIQEQQMVMDYYTAYQNAQNERKKAEIEYKFNNTWFGRNTKYLGLTLSNLAPILGPIGKATHKPSGGITINNN